MRRCPASAWVARETRDTRRGCLAARASARPHQPEGGRSAPSGGDCDGERQKAVEQWLFTREIEEPAFEADLSDVDAGFVDRHDLAAAGEDDAGGVIAFGQVC